MAHIVDCLPKKDLDDFFYTCTTIGGFIIFPANMINNKMTINGARGFNQKIADRMDLTLECIRRFYSEEDSPLRETLELYADFFTLFYNFRGYVDFFLLQNLVTDDYSQIKFFHSFNNFKYSPNPNTLQEYLIFKTNMLSFVNRRNKRIHEYAKCVK